MISGSSCVAGSARSVNEMSADPNVTAVGGTQFNPTYSGGNDLGHATEKVWNDGIGASGGGASQFFSKPGYQSGAGVPADGARDVPDIALIASPEFPGVFWGHDVGGTGQISCCVKRRQPHQRRSGRDFHASSHSSPEIRGLEI